MRNYRKEKEKCSGADLGRGGVGKRQSNAVRPSRAMDSMPQQFLRLYNKHFMTTWTSG